MRCPVSCSARTCTADGMKSVSGTRVTLKSAIVVKILATERSCPDSVAVTNVSSAIKDGATKKKARFAART